MLVYVDGQYFIPSLGLVTLPENLIRNNTNKSWRLLSSDNTFFEWCDNDFGFNPLDSLRKATGFSLTLGSLEPEERRTCVKLMKDRKLSNTGVFGVFYRSGLREQYQVIFDGLQIEVPYEKGKGFVKAVKTVSKLHKAKHVKTIECLEIDPNVTL